MKALDLLADLSRLGILLVAQGDCLRFSPRSAVTPDVLGQLKMHKAELLAILQPQRDQSDDSTIRCPWCGCQRLLDGESGLWCAGCERLAWLVTNERFTRADQAGVVVVPWPEPCSTCGGFDLWQDLIGEWHCASCRPAKFDAEQLRQLATDLRERARCG